MDLDGQSIVITGAFGTLGTSVAAAVVASGARVALIDQASGPSGGVQADGLLLPNVDLADSNQTIEAIHFAASKLGRITGLVNVAGTFRWETLEAGTIETWDLMYRVNLRTAVLTSKVVLPFLSAQVGGRIVNIGAGAAVKAAAGMGAYAAAKSGISRFTESLSEETKDRGITVNAVLPSIIDTPQNRRDMPDANFQRWVSPDAIAAAIVFLLSHRARAITGACIPLSGYL